MSSEEKFKKSLNELLGSKEFPFEERNWTEAEKFINASRRKKKLRPLLWLLPVLFGLGTLIYIVTDDNLPSADKNLSSLPASDPTPAEKTTVPRNHIPSDMNTPLSGESISKSEAEKPVAGNKARTTERTADETVIEDDLRNVKSTALQSPATETGDQMATTTEPPTSKSDHLKGLIRTAPVPREERTQETAAGKPTEKRADKKADVDGKTEENEQTAAQPILTPQDNEEPMPVLEANPIMKDLKAEEQAASAGALTADSTAPGKITVAGPDSAAMPAISAARPDTDYVRLKHPLLTIEAGTHASGGWQTETGREATGINPFAGIMLYHHINDQIALNTGIQYFSLGNLQASTYIAKTTNYAFGEQSQVKKFTPRRLHYLSLPLQASYKFSETGMFGAGINIAYLLTADVELEEYTEKMGATHNHQTSTERGYTQGFNTFNSQLGIFYRQRIWKNLFVNAEAFMGIRPLKNEFFAVSGKEKNTGIRLSIGYYLMRTR